MDAQVFAAPWETVAVFQGAFRQEGNEYVMNEGEVVSAWMGRNGPSEVTAYNWNKVVVKPESIYMDLRNRVQPDGGRGLKCHNYDDVAVLTDIGWKELEGFPNKIVYRMELACTGEGNCERECGAYGPEDCDCSGNQTRHHACRRRVVISRTLKDVSEGKVRIHLAGLSHVDEQRVERIPPAPNKLRADAKHSRPMLYDAAKGGLTVQQVRSKERPKLASPAAGAGGAGVC